MKKKDPTSLVDIQNDLPFRAIMDTSADAIVIIDELGTILFWNESAERMFGWTFSEMKGSKLDRIIPEKFRESHRTGIQRVSGGGKHHVIGNTVELSALNKDGHEFPIELSLSTWKTLDGTRYYGGILRDISDRKAAEAILRGQMAKYESLTETASDAIISSNNTGDIISWNAAAEKIFGHTKAEAIGQPLEMIIPEKYREAHRAGLDRISDGGQPKVIGHTVELIGLHRSGKEFPIELSLSTWENKDEISFCGIIRDITERKKQEEALAQSKMKLEEKANKLREANQHIKEKNEQLDGLAQKLAKYLSRQVYDSIFDGSMEVKIESYRKKLTIFFSDIVGFTALSDRIESEVLTSILNKYLNEMSKIATEYGGTIDKFIGDAIMIFFGDPTTEGDKMDALKCVKMALAMRKKLAELHKEWEQMGVSTPLNIRMGINTGYCTVGNFGSEERMDYTIVGSPVNLASRLQTKAEINQILISADTYLLVRDQIACVPKNDIHANGFSYPIPTYQVIDEVNGYHFRENKLISRQEGFELNLDASLINASNKNEIERILKEAMQLLEPE